MRVIETLTGVGPAELAQALPGGRQPDGTASNVAANVTIADAGEIGKVISAVGSVTLQRADGTTIVVAVGTVVLQNDVVITGAGSEVAITFTDESVFSLSENGRMTLDEYIYDSDGGAANMLVGLFTGTLAVVSGQIAPTGNMEVNTPVATLGIRGTSLVINLEGADLRVVLVTDVKDGQGGLIQIFDNATGDLLQELGVGQIGQLFQLDGTTGERALTDLTPTEQQIVQSTVQTLSQSYVSAQQNPIIPQSQGQQPGQPDDNDDDRQGQFETDSDTEFALGEQLLREYFNNGADYGFGGEDAFFLFGFLMFGDLLFGNDADDELSESDLTFLFLAGFLLFDPETTQEDLDLIEFLINEGIEITISDDGVIEILDEIVLSLIGDQGDTFFDIADYRATTTADFVAVSYVDDPGPVFVNVDISPHFFGGSLPTVGGLSARDGWGDTDTFNALPDGVADSGFDDHFHTGSQTVVIGLSEGNDVVSITPGGQTRISYFDAGAGVSANLSTGTASEHITATGLIGNDSFTNAVGLEGSNFADNLVGNALNNDLLAEDGNDILQGEGGDDFLSGGAGDDLLIGGAGADTFDYDLDNILDGDVDTISGFETAFDTIDIEDLLITAFSSLASDFINVAPSAGSAFVQIDIDGTGTNHGFQTIAEITSGAALGDTITFDHGAGTVTVNVGGVLL